MKDIIHDLLQDLHDGMEQGQRIFFGNAAYDSLTINTNNFHPIPEAAGFQQLAFVDGGNQEIMGGSNFTLQLQRVAVCVYSHLKCIRHLTYQYLLYLKAKRIEGKLCYEAVRYSEEPPLDLPPLRFNPFDPCLVQGTFRADIRKVADICRRIAELRVAALTAQILSGGLLVIDGTLQTSHPYEEQSLTQLKEQKTCLFCSVAKTDSFITDRGNSVAYLLQQMAPVGSWYYHPSFTLKQGTAVDIAFAKLHPKSNYLFRIEFLLEQDKQQLFSSLAKHATDPVFLGYPYGLVLADQLARIQNSEAEMTRTTLAVRLGQDWKRFLQHATSRNAHAVLDSIY
ncbi:hypothetical protein HZB01_03000 [Candidatus Woesearchaeota archaeon]|nr:hypothetical protein [Candidatus Woesearchaeota archaeon]